jgi:hypothetical protein
MDFEIIYNIVPVHGNWNIQYSDNVSKCDDIFPNDLFCIIINKNRTFANDILQLNVNTSYTKYLCDMPPYDESIKTDADYNKLIIKKQDKYGFIYKIQNKLIKNDNIIVSYNFSHRLSLFTYSLLKSHNIYVENDKVLIYAQNHYILDGLVFYLKYRKIVCLKNIHISLKEWFEKSQTDTKTHIIHFNYVKSNHIDTTFVTSPEATPVIIKSKLVFIDIIIRLSNFYYRLNYNLQILFHYLEYGLQSLISGGTLVLYIPIITNKIVYDFICDLATHFEESKILIQPVEDVYPIFYIVLLKGYKETYPIKTLQ